jgi:hypothetical protein
MIKINLLYIYFFTSQGKSLILVTYKLLQLINNIKWIRDIVEDMSDTPFVVQTEPIESMIRLHISFLFFSRF